MKCMSVLISISPLSAQAIDEATQNAIQSKVTKAVLAYPEVKQTTKKYTKKAIDYVGLGKTTQVILGVIGRSSVAGKIDTRQIKYNLKVLEMNTKPYVNYDWKNGKAEAGVWVNFDF